MGLSRCLLSTWPEGDADVLWGHLRATGGGIDLHLDLGVLHGLLLTAPPAQVHLQVAALARVRPIRKVLQATNGPKR